LSLYFIRKFEKKQGGDVCGVIRNDVHDVVFLYYAAPPL